MFFAIFLKPLLLCSCSYFLCNGEIVPSTYTGETRLNNETDKAWVAFQDYRNLGIGRSLSKLARKYQEESKAENGGRIPPTKSEKTLGNWSDKFDWVERVKAWDRAQDKEKAEIQRKKRREQWEAEVEAYRDRNKRAGSALFELAVTLSKKSLATIKKDELDTEQAIRTLSAIARLTEVAQSTEGTALGVADLLESLDDD